GQGVPQGMRAGPWSSIQPLLGYVRQEVYGPALLQIACVARGSSYLQSCGLPPVVAASGRSSEGIHRGQSISSRRSSAPRPKIQYRLLRASRESRGRIKISVSKNAGAGVGWRYVILCVAAAPGI